MRKLAPLIARRTQPAIKPPPNTVLNPHYETPEHKAWRAQVYERAGHRCQAIDDNTGTRCRKAAPEHRLFADHIRELQDGGAPLDIANGRCLCGSHHTAKTAEERRRRLGTLG